MNTTAGPTCFHSTYPLLLAPSPSTRSHRDVGAGLSEEDSSLPKKSTAKCKSLSRQAEFVPSVGSGGILRLTSDATFTAPPSSSAGGDGAAVMSPKCASAKASRASLLAYCKMAATVAGSVLAVCVVAAGVVAMVQLLALGDVMGEDPSFVPSRPLIRGHFPEGPVRQAGGRSMVTTATVIRSASKGADASPTSAAPTTGREMPPWAMSPEAEPHS